ncbi:MAG TPA: JAB domain-containing protein [Bacteroidia bacterium]|nr:JAB domain-containing protein [Bacteroidia bacterium]HRH07608.1 JAB domain-containing protein [Bacteroidia bacterium]
MTNEFTSDFFSINEVELVYRSKTRAADRPKITTSKDAHNLLMLSWDFNKMDLLEEFKIILLDRKNSCIGISNIATGGITGCVVDPKVIFATALKARATGIILSHNHPSGNLKPSQEDISITKKLIGGGKLLDINILDHLILTSENYCSLTDEGLIP